MTGSYLGTDLIFLLSFLVITITLVGYVEADEQEKHPPVVIISSPLDQMVFDTRDHILFDGSQSHDSDMDELTYRWIHSNRTLMSEERMFSIDANQLGPGVHVVLLSVSDGEFDTTNFTCFKIEMHPDEVDTDGDGIPDGVDSDSDNDGLLDSEELELGTDPLNMDTDRDGISDHNDEEPLNPGLPPPNEEVSADLFMISMIVLFSIGFFLSRKRTH